MGTSRPPGRGSSRPSRRLKRGGTSLWEDWGNGAPRNHIMFGEFVCWAYQYLAGIRLQDDAVGFNRVLIDPVAIPDLSWAAASVRLPTGVLSSRWERKEDEVSLAVTVPRGVEAEIVLPSGRRSISGPQTWSGTYR